MRKLVSKVHLGLAWLTMAAVIVQFFLAGLGVFGDQDFVPHMANGSLILFMALLLSLLALAGWLGSKRIGLSLLLLALMLLQAVLAYSPTTIAALHPVNGLAILFVTYKLARCGSEIGASIRPSRSSRPASSVQESRV